MRLVVLSLDNETGKARRTHLNYPYQWNKAIDGDDRDNPYVKYVRDNLQVMKTTGPTKLRGISGCFATHWAMWDTIARNNWYNTIVLEDDAIQIQDLPNKADLPTDAPCLLGGQIHHPTSWKMNADFHQSGRDKEIIGSFTTGTQPIDYDTYRWSQTFAIYIPTPAVAKRLSESVRRIGKFTHVDLWLSKHHLINHLYFPSPFKHHDILNKSQVASNPGIIIDYRKVPKGDVLLPHKALKGL